MDIDAFVSALMFQAGYNTTIVAIGALFLGLAGGMVGTFLLLRRRSLVSDALSHATLPGVGIAFLAMAALGGTGRFLPGLLLGAALSAYAGLAVVEWLTRRTRLNADAAIGAVLSTFFGFGVVLLTVIQSAQIGQQAGIGSFLLGSTSGMLRSEASMLAALAAASVVAVFWMRRVFVLVSFDETFASSTGIDIRRADLILMLLVLAVTVTGLRIVGLVLVIALLIIPPVAARFWTEKVDRMMLISGAIGAAAGFFGTALSASIPNLPTGPIMVLVATAIFAVSMFFAPRRGVLSNLYRARAFSSKVHLRQGLLALHHDEMIYDPQTLRVLAAEDFIRPDGQPTREGQAAARRAAEEEALWTLYLNDNPDSLNRTAGMLLDPLDKRLGAGEIAALRGRLAANPPMREEWA